MIQQPYFTIHDIECIGFTCIDRLNVSSMKIVHLTLKPLDVIENFKIPAALPLLFKSSDYQIGWDFLQAQLQSEQILILFNYHVTIWDVDCKSVGVLRRKITHRKSETAQNTEWNMF